MQISRLRASEVGKPSPSLIFSLSLFFNCSTALNSPALAQRGTRLTTKFVSPRLRAVAHRPCGALAFLARSRRQTFSFTRSLRKKFKPLSGREARPEFLSLRSSMVLWADCPSPAAHWQNQLLDWRLYCRFRLKSQASTRHISAYLSRLEGSEVEQHNRGRDCDSIECL